MADPTAPLVLRAVAAPPMLLHASVSLVKAEAAACFMLGVLLREPLISIVLFFVMHAMAIVLTRRDPYLVEVMQARWRCKRTRNLRPAAGNRYVP